MGIIRQWSNNDTVFCLALYNLFKRRRLSQAQKIVLEEGFMMLFLRMLHETDSFPGDFELSRILEYSRHFFGILVNGAKTLNAMPLLWN